MPARMCHVSFRDAEGLTHGVEVGADTLYEAVALALVRFRQAGLVEVHIGKSTELIVRVSPPAEEHRLTLSRFESWLNAGGRGPADHVRKQRLREILEQE